jgi:hypothetical protein
VLSGEGREGEERCASPALVLPPPPTGRDYPVSRGGLLGIVFYCDDEVKAEASQWSQSSRTPPSLRGGLPSARGSAVRQIRPLCDVCVCARVG